MEITDHAYVSAFNSYAIYTRSELTTILISGESKVVSMGTRPVIYLFFCNLVEIKDNAQVISKSYPIAIFDYYDFSYVSVEGRLVFAITDDVYTVVQHSILMVK